MNVNRARGGDDDLGAVGAEPTMPAKYAGTCATCRQRFAAGDPIASVLVDKKMTYHHGACRYPATALLAHDTTEVDVDVVAAARKASKPGKCRATTNKGKPCNNTPQKGEQFCGPHLTQLVARPSPDGQPTSPTLTTNRSDLGPTCGEVISSPISDTHTISTGSRRRGVRAIGDPGRAVRAAVAREHDDASRGCGRRYRAVSLRLRLSAAPALSPQRAPCTVCRGCWGRAVGCQRHWRTGTVTFLFTDIEGSTERWQLDSQAMADALAAHDELIRSALTRRGGVVFKHTGDGMCVVFAPAPEAVAAAIEIQAILVRGSRRGRREDR